MLDKRFRFINLFNNFIKSSVLTREKMVNYFLPTRRTYEILGWILLIVLIISICNFPLMIFMNGQISADTTLNIGWPTTFFRINLTTPDAFPIITFPLIISLIAYTLVAYSFDVVIGFFMRKFKQSKENKTLAEQVQLAQTNVKTEQIIQKTPEIDPVIDQAKKAYSYYTSQGMKEEEVISMFKQKGWKDEDIKKLK